MTKATLFLSLSFTFALSLAACGSSSEDGAKSCTTNQECGQSALCLTNGQASACAPICSGSVGECSGSAQCGGVGVLSVSACQEPKASSAEDPPKAEEQPHVPCATDDECKPLDARAICAQFRGAKDCTIPCTSESACDLPALGGVKIDFLTCANDEANTARQACLPDERCFGNPLTCVTLGP